MADAKLERNPDFMTQIYKAEFPGIQTYASNGWFDWHYYYSSYYDKKFIILLFLGLGFRVCGAPNSKP
jgi:hypothetical protein